MVADAELQHHYDALFAYARATAECLVRSASRPRTARALRVRSAALALLDRQARAAPTEAGGRSAAHDALDALAEDWPDLASGSADGVDLMQCRPGLWARLMTEWPMMDYADLLMAAVRRQPRERGRVLEVGAGVGNTTARLSELFGNRLVWTDRDNAFVHTGRWGGTGRVFDFDHAPPSDLGRFAMIVATNSVHCAADPAQTLRRLRDLLVPGGALLVAEGSSPTRHDGSPWALDILFSAFDGWWDRSGFRTRQEWLNLLAAQGFTEIECVPLVVGADDLGGVLTARRPHD